MAIHGTQPPTIYDQPLTPNIIDSSVLVIFSFSSFKYSPGSNLYIFLGLSADRKTFLLLCISCKLLVSLVLKLLLVFSLP